MRAARARTARARLHVPFLLAAAAAAGCTAVLGYPDRVSLDELPDGGSVEGGSATDGAPADGGGGGDATADAKDGAVCTVLGACPVAAYDFDEGMGTLTKDSSGNKNDGTLAGVTWAMGKLGSAVSFDGKNVFVTVPSSTSLDVTGTHLTLAFWAFVVDDQTHDHVLLAKPWIDGMQGGGPPSYQYAVEFNRGGKTFDFILGTVAGDAGGTSTRKMSIPAGTTSTWTHVAFTYDGVMQRAYVNGAMISQLAATGTLPKRGTSFRMGVDSVGSQGFSGRLDAVRIYDEALTAPEIAALHDGT
jgi:hypothetical protein